MHGRICRKQRPAQGNRPRTGNRSTIVSRIMVFPKVSRRRLTVAPQADPSSLPDARMVNRLSSRLCRKKSEEKIEPDFNRSFSPFLSPPWPRSIAHKRLASMDSGYNQRHDFLSFNHFPEPVGEGEMEEEIVCNRWRDLAGEQIFGQLVRPKDCSPSRLSEEMSVVWASHSAQGHFFPSNDQPPTTFSFFLLAVRSLLARYTIVFLFSRDRRDGK